ncbi:MAG: hypothetical protein KKC14_18280 [Alphaproteobacteria bacterium]|nr:hypothetical protein [Alphaproteobacteria bacterium]
MVFFALLLAAAVQVASPSDGVVASQGQAAEARPRPAAVRDLAAALDHCFGQGIQRVDHRDPAGAIQRLGDLPMANHTLTVLRTQGGCPVSSTIRYNVGR